MNRDQFIAALNSTFYPLVFPDNYQAFEAVFTNNQTKMYTILTRYLRAQGRIAFYLAAWDAAPDQAAKDAVAGSVTADLGSATVDPATALSWPTAGGVFGNIKGPSSAAVGNISSFNSTTGQLLSDSGVAAVRSQSSASRSLNTAYQVSTTRDSLVNYSVDIACTLNLTTGQTGTVFLEIATNSAFTTGVQELCRFVNGNTGTLTIGLNLSQNVTGGLNGYVPAGYWVRIRTANTTGTPTFTYRSGQEVLI